MFTYIWCTTIRVKICFRQNQKLVKILASSEMNLSLHLFSLFLHSYICDVSLHGPLICEKKSRLLLSGINNDLRAFACNAISFTISAKFFNSKNL